METKVIFVVFLEHTPRWSWRESSLMTGWGMLQGFVGKVLERSFFFHGSFLGNWFMSQQRDSSIRQSLVRKAEASDVSTHGTSFLDVFFHVWYIYLAGVQNSIFTISYHLKQSNVCKYTIHGWYGRISSLKVMVSTWKWGEPLGKGDSYWKLLETHHV